MEEIYNVLKEPWIKTEDFEGNFKRYGIIDLLAKAQSIKAITYASPLEEFSVYRLLNVFLMDALRPETIDDIQDLLDNGNFDSDRIQEYVKQCLEEGVSFDLFDENRPFMQGFPNKNYEKDSRSVNYLDYSIPTGNNAVHFDHLESDHAVEYADILPKIIACQLFATAGVQGFPSSINGAPPYFSIVVGNSLFETLIYMMVPIEEISISFDNPKVYWRNKQEIIPKETVTRTSWLYGMLYPARRIRCIHDEDGRVRDVYFGQGSNFTDQSNWTDPEVTYRFNDSGRFPWRPDTGKAIWRNLSDLIDIKGKRAPVILNVFRRICGSNKYARIKLYGVQTNQASYLDLAGYDMQIPETVIEQQDRISLIREYIGDAEETAIRIGQSFSGKNLPSGLSSVLTTVKDVCIRNYYSETESVLWELCNTYLSDPAMDESTCREFWKSEISRVARKQVRNEMEKLQLPGKYLIQIYKNQIPLLKYLNELEKDGES